MNTPRLWFISGSGRKVGKTCLAIGLEPLLPASLYCKIGNSARKSDRPGHYFHGYSVFLDFLREIINLKGGPIDVHGYTEGCDCDPAQKKAYENGYYEHLIIESNTLSLSKLSGIRIYIEGADNSRISEPRPDRNKLRKMADITIDMSQQSDDGATQYQSSGLRHEWAHALREFWPECSPELQTRIISELEEASRAHPGTAYPDYLRAGKTLKASESIDVE